MPFKVLKFFTFSVARKKGCDAANSLDLLGIKGVGFQEFLCQDKSL
jgi:hypothetical protein